MALLPFPVRTIPPLIPPVTPRFRGVGDGRDGRVGGLTPNPIRAGVNIAFGSSINDEVPLWQLLDKLGPT